MLYIQLCVEATRFKLLVLLVLQTQLLMLKIENWCLGSNIGVDFSSKISIYNIDVVSLNMARGNFEDNKIILKNEHIDKSKYIPPNVKD